MTAPGFSHISGDRAKMVDISDKDVSVRSARAVGSIKLKESTIQRIREGQVEKGNVLLTARIAGIMAVKNTSAVIPMCHQIPITDIDLKFNLEDDHITASATVKSIGRTGVEMDALHGVSTALLTIWDMVKSNEKDATGNYPETRIEEIQVEFKVKRDA